MRRTGNPGLGVALALALAVPSLAQADDVEFYQTVDQKEIGTEDTLRLTILSSNAPDDAQIKFPATDDFEILSRSQSTEMSYHLGGGGPGTVKRVNKWTLVLRPTRAGTLTIPSSLLITGSRNYRSDALTIAVKRGKLRQPPPPPDPRFPFSLLDEPDDQPDEDVDVQIPRTDSDLFLRSSLDQPEAFMGEQVTLSVYVYSRVDLSSVETFNMPKLDGFWSEDVDSPNQLAGEQRLVNGVPYRAYLLRRRVLFPMKPGTIHLDAAEADVVTGFLFANRRAHRKGNPLDLKVKPLPPGKPAGFLAGNVGQWRLSAEVADSRVPLGTPLTVRVILEGRGNLKNVAMPQLQAPSGLKAYDPSTTDKEAMSRGKLGGRRVQEYLVMPTQTGTFTVPALSFAYFDPALERYAVSQTDPIEVNVLPATGGPIATSDGQASQAAAKNVLMAGGLKPLRYQASFDGPRVPVWRRVLFAPLVGGPVLLLVAAMLGTAVRQRLSREDPEASRRRQARAARARLSAAQKLRAQGKPAEFYGEVEKAVSRFLEAKLGIPVAGLTREALDQEMAARGVPGERRQRVLAVLDQCDAGRFAPGAGDEVRGQVLDEAAQAMGGWR